MKKHIILMVSFLISLTAYSTYAADIVVAADGSGQYTSIGEALDNVPYYNYERLVIYVKNGVYNEKILINRDHLTILGEDREKTIIQYSQLRDDWVKNKDHIGPAVINIHADDIILDNLTVRNTQLQIGPHAFAIHGTGTRTIITNCTVTSRGGDTLALWNYKNGMYYHDNCTFKGAVDFVCPRGWCYISNSSFVELKKTAAVWHAAPHNSNQKFVMKACDFSGVDSFYLARHHYDAQFYFIDCHFSKQMKNMPIEHVHYSDQPNKNRPYNYGDRHYFFNCNSDGKKYAWFNNNIEKSPDGATDYSPEWTFDGVWNPLDTSRIDMKAYTITDQLLVIDFFEPVMVVNKPNITLSNQTTYAYVSGSGWSRLVFEKITVDADPADVKIVGISGGEITNIMATCQPRWFSLGDKFSNNQSSKSANSNK